MPIREGDVKPLPGTLSAYADQQEVDAKVVLPPGYTIFWSGQFESMQRARARLALIVPITLFLIFLILYVHTKSFIKTAIVLSAIPFSLVGSIWLLDLLGYNWSVAVVVGLIALAGLAAENGTSCGGGSASRGLRSSNGKHNRIEDADREPPCGERRRSLYECTNRVVPDVDRPRFDGRRRFRR